MSIPYNYEIVSVDEQARTMEVVYTSDGRQTMHIGARLPYEGETLEAVVAMYSPVAYWAEQDAVVVSPAVGLKGSFAPEQPVEVVRTIESAKAEKLNEISAWRYGIETGGISLNGVSVRTDRESQAQVTGAYTGLKNGLLSSVNWKDANGQWAPLTIVEIEPVARAVASHVQACFDAEMELAKQVNSATTIEEVDAVVVPNYLYTGSN